MGQDNHVRKMKAAEPGGAVVPSLRAIRADLRKRATARLSQHYCTIRRIDSDKQVVVGVVYEPDVLDTYTEFMTSSDIELMAHRFMQLDLSKSIDTQHDNVPNGCYPVESFIARAGDPDYPEGAWVLGVKVADPILWHRVKSGQINGFSFQCMVQPREYDVTYEAIRDHVGRVEKSEDHTHEYFVQVDEKGMVVGGVTSVAKDHFHLIRRASHTEDGANHSHRYFL